jgi:(p)ppGpp synthase/HD superfamily hydrolase
MAENIDINDDFRLALCCNPAPHDKITGFLKPDSGIISVHKNGCHNLKSIQPERLVNLGWKEIIRTESPDKVAVKIDRATVFKRHRKLRDLKLLARVQPKMIQYRKNIVDNKWIKHRNHTYYEITARGSKILERAG